MNDFADLVPLVASALGLAPSTLLLLIAVVHLAAKTISRLIPNDATGWQAQVRNICSVLGVDVSARLTSGVSVQDVAMQTIAPPVDKPVAEKVADAKGVDVLEVTPHTEGS